MSFDPSCHTSLNEELDHRLRAVGESIAWACGQYDAGYKEMAIQIAVAALPLFEGANGEEPILTAHDRLSPIGLISTTTFGHEGGNSLGFLQLAPSEGSFRCELHRAARAQEISLDEWWRREIVFRLLKPLNLPVTRRNLIVSFGGQAGHPAALSAEALNYLKKGMTFRLQVKFRDGPMQWVDLRDAHLPALRQIGYEILHSPMLRKLGGAGRPREAQRPLPRRIKVEDVMDHCVASLGGIRVDKVMKAGPGSPNADYAFLADRVIAELKCLEIDKTEDGILRQRVQEVFDECIRRRFIPDPGPGLHRMDSNVLPPRYQRKLYQVLSRSIKRRLSKANLQIKETRKALGLADAHGLVLLANDGNFLLEPPQLIHAVNVALGDDFSAIDTVILFTPNMLAVTPHRAQHAKIWIEAGRPGHKEISPAFLERFRSAWQDCETVATGAVVTSRPEVSVSDLADMRFDRAISEQLQD